MTVLPSVRLLGQAHGAIIDAFGILGRDSRLPLRSGTLWGMMCQYSFGELTEWLKVLAC